MKTGDTKTTNKKAKYDVRPYNANMNTRSFAFDPFVSWHGAMNFHGCGTP